jgi:mannose-6-phosphate isomerase
LRRGINEVKKVAMRNDINREIQPYFSKKIWGGSFISKHYSLNSKEPIGEAFLVSTLLNHESSVNHIPLSVVLDSELSFLIKFIDAVENLSIQVHPNDEWANKLERSVGKTECWLVYDAKEGAGVYHGFKEGQNFDSMMRKINEGENASDSLNFIPVKKGDFIAVPAGTIHAIGAGVQILEFQQSSGITYRIWDWGREGREIHLDKARVVTTETNYPEILNFSNFENDHLFFSHSDFELVKSDDKTILCRSNLVPYKALVQVENLSVRI